MTTLVDERDRSFSETELRIACTLADEGHRVVAVGDRSGTPSNPPHIGRPDARVDGRETGFETLEAGATGAALAMALSRAARHAGYAIVDARSTGLSRLGACAGLRLFGRIGRLQKLYGYRVIGDDFDLTAP